MKRLTLLLLWSIAVLTAGAQVGSLDPSFGNNGIVTDFEHTVFKSTLLQGNKIVVAGYTIDLPPHNSDFALARYTPNGVPDSSFGTNGKVTTDFSGFRDVAASVLLQGDKIIAAGSTENSSGSGFALARYTANGNLDSSFGKNGRVTTDVNEFAGGVGSAISALLQGERIIVAGESYDPSSGYGYVFLRYTKDGVPDSSFGTNGIVKMDGFVFCLALQGEKIIMAGTTGTYPFSFSLARYTKDGVLDASFGVNGKVTTDFNGYSAYGTDRAYSALLQGDKIVVAGQVHDFVTYLNDFALVRYTADGVLDSSFGQNGKVITDINGTEDYVFSAILQGEKIIVAGQTSPDPNSSPFDFALARYTKNGVLDSSFSEDGIQTTHLGDFSAIDDLALLDNRLIAIGYLANSEGMSSGVIAGYQLEKEALLPSISSFTLVNASSDKDIQALQDGEELNLTKLPLSRLNIRANTSPSKVGSVVLELSGAQSRKQVENGVPYALFKNLRGDYFGGNLQAGEYTLTATSYTKAKGQGQKGTPLTVHFKVVYPASVVRFTLVNAETEEDIRELKEDDVLNLSSLHFTKLSVKANTSPAVVGSVVLALSGQQAHHQTENLTPYALYGGNPYNAWTPEVGAYTLTATPFSAREGKGAKGTSYTVHFTVTQGLPFITAGNKSVQTPLPAPTQNAKLSASPNPFTSQSIIRFSVPATGYVTLNVYDAKGLEATKLYQGLVEANREYRVPFGAKVLPSGVYLIRLIANGQTTSLKTVRLR